MSRLSSIILLAAAVQAVYATNCDVDNTEVETQSDIDGITGCTVLTGSIGIYRTFKGAFSLPGVTSLDYLVAGNPGASHSTPTLGTPLVTSISFPDLETISDIEISGVPNLVSFSMPNLKSVSGLFELGSMGSVTSLSFPNLESTGGNTIIGGDFDAIDLSGLKSATTIYIDSTGNLDCAALGEQLSTITWVGDYAGLDCTSSLNAYHSATTAFSSLFPNSAGVVHATSVASTTSTSLAISTTSTAEIFTTLSTEATSTSSTSELSTSTSIASTTTSAPVFITTTSSIDALTTATAPISSSLSSVVTSVTKNASLISSSATTTSSTVVPTTVSANKGTIMNAGIWGTMAGSVAVVLLMSTF